MSNKAKSQSPSDTWLTSKDFYEELNKRFRFDDFDPCPPDNNIELFDGLTVDWADRTFCNPPYSKTLKEKFLYKAYAESLKGKLIVLLLPVSTGTKIFHELIQPNAKVEFIKGRLKFEGIDNKGNWINPNCGMSRLKNIPGRYIERTINRSGQNDSMLVIFDGRNYDF